MRHRNYALYFVTILTWFPFEPAYGASLTCGDGVVDSAEECDDANLAAADGCSEECAVEQCWSCSGAPSACLMASDGAMCDDADLCTITDVCTGGVCGGVAEPDPTCRVAGRPALRMTASDEWQYLNWKWKRGDATTSEDFGSPGVNGTTDYTLCIYDESANPQPIARLQWPHRCTVTTACWNSDRHGGLVYDANTRYAVHQYLSLRAGDDGRARVLLKAHGFRDDPDPASPLPLAPTVTVQLKNSDGVCWQSSHSTPVVNSGSKFSAR